MLLRIAKRNTSAELTDVVEYVQAEFSREDGSLDLTLSTYEISSDQAIRAHTEHYAGLLANRASAKIGLVTWQTALAHSGTSDNARLGESRDPDADRPQWRRRGETRYMSKLTCILRE